MNIVLDNIGKRFNKEWIFRNLNTEFSIGNKYAMLGTNGCGKSTLAQIIARAVSQSEGKISMQINKQQIEEEDQFRHLSFASPYLELPEEMTWKEAIEFHGKFKSFTSGLTTERVIEQSGLRTSSDKEIRNFSSGMKQRARLALAILSNTPLLILDEPSTNLDANAVQWYQNLIKEHANEKLVIVCSNYNKEEYVFCNKEFILSEGSPLDKTST